MVKTIKFITAALLVIAVCGAARAQKVVEAIVAVVNDDVITLSEYKNHYDMLYEAVKAQVKDQNFTAQFEQAKKTLLDSMITDMLLLQEAKKEGINVDEQLKQALEKIKKDNNLQNDAELIKAVEQQGTSFELFQDRMRENLMRQGVMFTEIRRSIVIDDADYVDYYKKHPEEFIEPAEYKIRAIYVSGENRTEEEVKSRKKEIDDKLAAGEDMADVAAEYSDGPEKKSKGDLGTFKSGELAKELEDAVKDLNVGETAPWLAMQSGWFKLKLEEKKESLLKSFEESRQAIEMKLYQKLEQEKMQDYIAKLRKKSYIKILIPHPEDLF